MTSLIPGAVNINLSVLAKPSGPQPFSQHPPSTSGESSSASTEPTAPCAPEGEAPPPYTTLPRSPSDVGSTQWSGPGTASSGAGYAPSGVRLGYVDFVPRPVRKRMFKDDLYETFE